jgi:predicted transcriptional regulator
MTPQPDDHNPGMTSTETSQELLDMIMGFRITQMIYVAAKLGIADLLKNGPETMDTLAQATRMHAPSLYRLLRALASVGIFAEDAQRRFALTPLGDLLQAGVPGS